MLGVECVCEETATFVCVCVCARAKALFAFDYFMHTSVRCAVGERAGVTANSEPYLLKDICSACLHKVYLGATG